MSHDENEMACPCNSNWGLGSHKCKQELCEHCTCPPADSASIDWEGIKITAVDSPPTVDEAEQIRYRTEQDWKVKNNVGIGATQRCFCHRYALLRIVDQLRAELAAAQSELERVRDELNLSRKLTSWVRANHPHIADAAILAALQEQTK